MKLVLVAIIAGLIVLGLGAPSRSQEIQRIAAIVNDDVISMYDLLSRLRMVIATSRLPDTPDTRQRLAPQVLRNLIDETLKLQEARRLNLKVTEKELQRAVADLERANNIAPGSFDSFLQSAGVEKGTVLSQLKASFAWNKVVGQRIRPRVTVGQEEVDEVLERIRRNQGRQEFLVSEIFLSVDSPEQEASVRETAERLTEQIREGASFGVIAQQFSQSGTASTDGDMGWVQKGQLDEEIEAALSLLAPGQTSEPISTLQGFYILQLRERRTLAAQAPEERSVSLRQIVLKIPDDPSADDLVAQRELAQTITEVVRGCEDFEKLATELGDTSSGALNKIRIKDLAEEVKPIAVAAELGQPSDPLSSDESMSVVMVCQRDAEADLPARDEITATLGRQRINILTRRYLRDLRLGAFLDVRV